MACSVTVLSPQRTPLAQQALGRVCMPVARRQARATSIAALGDFDVAQTVATSVELGSAPEVSVTSVYIGLGLLLASFVATFGVAPMFRSSFKEEDTWMDIYEDLTKNMGGVTSIEPQEAARKAQSGAVLMDVRLAQKYFANACPDSQSFPLYQPISGMGLAANIRRAAFTFFGVFGTERNMQWLQQVEEAVPKSALILYKQVIVVCDHGGSLQPTNGASTGFQSQSLKAAYYLKKAGYTKVLHMKGGVSKYRRAVADLVPGEEAFAY